MRKLLITGGEGFLGVRAAAYYSQRGWDVAAYGHHSLDITDSTMVTDVFLREAPQAVLHCAAISDTGYAQAHPQISEAINLHGTINVASASQMCGAKLVYMSSDQVYNGNNQRFPLPEQIALTPKNIYATHKLQAEAKVTQICPTAVGLRLTWMYDRLDSTYRLNQNLLVNLATAEKSGVPLKGAIHELRGITFVWDVISRLERCFDLPGGVYNFGCENQRNTYDTLCGAAKLCGYDPQKIVTAEESFSRNLSMDTKKLQDCGIAFPDTLDGLREALSQDSY